MSLVVLPFCDGFDHYLDESLKWNTTGGSSGIDLSGTASRTGIGCLLCGGVDGPLLVTPQLTRVVAGGAFYPDGLGGAPKGQIMVFLQGSTNSLQLMIATEANGDIAVFSGSPTGRFFLGSTPGGILAANGYNYIEVDAQISLDATVVVRVNGVVVLTLNHVVTIDPGGASFVDQFQLKGLGGGATSRWDDVYLLPDPGIGVPMGQAFLGAVRIYAVVPTSNGSVNNWTPLAGTNFSEVNEIPPDGDASYNSSPTVGAQDQYVYQLTGPPANSAIKFVQHTMDMRVDSGALTVASDAGGNVSPGNPLNSNYLMYKQPYVLNPGTGNPWSAADFPAQFGPKVTA